MHHLFLCVNMYRKTWKDRLHHQNHFSSVISQCPNLMKSEGPNGLQSSNTQGEVMDYSSGFL